MYCTSTYYVITSKTFLYIPYKYHKLLSINPFKNASGYRRSENFHQWNWNGPMAIEKWSNLYWYQCQCHAILYGWVFEFQAELVTKLQIWQLKKKRILSLFFHIFYQNYQQSRQRLQKFNFQTHFSESANQATVSFSVDNFCKRHKKIRIPIWLGFKVVMPNFPSKSTFEYGPHIEFAFPALPINSIQYRAVN